MACISMVAYTSTVASVVLQSAAGLGALSNEFVLPGRANEYKSQHKLYIKCVLKKKYILYPGNYSIRSDQSVLFRWPCEWCSS